MVNRPVKPRSIIHKFHFVSDVHFILSVRNILHILYCVIFLFTEKFMESPNLATSCTCSVSSDSNVSINKTSLTRNRRKQRTMQCLPERLHSTSSTGDTSDSDDLFLASRGRKRKTELQKDKRNKQRKMTLAKVDYQITEGPKGVSEEKLNGYTPQVSSSRMMTGTRLFLGNRQLNPTNLYVEEDVSSTSFESVTSVTTEEGSNQRFSLRLALINDLKDFWLETKQTSASMAVLLKKLRPHFPTLPLDPRTLLPVEEEASSFSIKSVSPGAYLHFGVRRGLEAILLEMNEDKNVIRIILHIDGVNIFKSAMKVFWPILVAINGVDGSTFIAGIYFGESKPDSVGQFLDDTITEIQELLGSGISTANCKTSVQISHCACDSIARAYIKNIKSPTGFYACDRCVQRGETVNKGRRFLDHSARRRTDQSFRLKEYVEHHRGDSPFLKITDMDLVFDFPNDYMHSVCEGIVPKILELLREAGGQFRLSAYCLSQMNSDIFDSRKCVTNDFQRRPRSLNHLSKWKATEHRLFCLYFGHSIVTKYNSTVGLLLRRLGVILRILCHPKLSKTMNGYCLRLTNFFLESCRVHFGESFITLTVHSLIHLVEDCRLRGSADTFSSFQFENFLQYVVGCVHSPYRPLEQMRSQVSRRGQRLGHKLKNVETNPNSDFNLKYPIDIGSVSGTLIGHTFHDFECLFRSVAFHSSQIMGYGANRYVLCNDKVVLKVKYIGVKYGTIYYIGRYLRSPASAFTDPLNSAILDIYQGSHFSFSYKCVPINEVQCKLLRHNDCFYPLLHTYTK